MTNSLYQKSTHWAKKLGHRHGLVVLVLVGLFVILIPLIYVTSGQLRCDRIFGISFIFLILSLALFDNLFETSGKEKAWRAWAIQTGLTCQMGTFLLGYPVEVMGMYRQRKVRLYTYKQGKGQVASTCLELVVNNPVAASLRLRGPFSRDEAASNKVVSDMFSATEARQFGDNKRFFIRSKPVHLLTTIFRADPLHSKLLQMAPLSNIELEGQRLRFEQLGIVVDVDYLQFLVDLLSDLADTIDHGAYVNMVRGN